MMFQDCQSVEQVDTALKDRMQDLRAKRDAGVIGAIEAETASVKANIAAKIRCRFLGEYHNEPENIDRDRRVIVEELADTLCSIGQDVKCGAISTGQGHIRESVAHGKARVKFETLEKQLADLQGEKMPAKKGAGLPTLSKQKEAVLWRLGARERYIDHRVETGVWSEEEAKTHRANIRRIAAIDVDYAATRNQLRELLNNHQISTADYKSRMADCQRTHNEQMLDFGNDVNMPEITKREQKMYKRQKVEAKKKIVDPDNRPNIPKHVLVFPMSGKNGKSVDGSLLHGFCTVRHKVLKPLIVTPTKRQVNRSRYVRATRKRRRQRSSLTTYREDSGTPRCLLCGCRLGKRAAAWLQDQLEKGQVVEFNDIIEPGDKRADQHKRIGIEPGATFRTYQHYGSSPLDEDISEPLFKAAAIHRSLERVVADYDRGVEPTPAPLDRAQNWTAQIRWPTPPNKKIGKNKRIRKVRRPEPF